MRKTKHCEQSDAMQYTCDTPRLAQRFGCGICTARKIGEAAKARIQIGRRVLWNVSKVQEYLDSIAE